MPASVVLLMALALTACRVDGTVTVDVTSDGSGVVTVEVTADAEAVGKIGDPAKALRLSDLSEAGWKVDPPSVDRKSGALSLRATRPFRSSAELAEVLSDIGRGPEAGNDSRVPFISGVSLRVSDAFARTAYSFNARLRLGGGLAQLSDPALTEVLDGLPVGRTPEELAAAGVGGKGVGTLRIRVRLPGGTTQHNGTKVDGAVEWSAPIGAEAAVDERLVARSTSVQRQVQILALAGVVVLAVAVAIGVVGIARRRR